jgi:hypothetical protein
MIALTKEKFAKIETRLKNIPEGSKYIRVVINTAPEEKFQVKATTVFHKKEYYSDEVDFKLEHALIKVVNETARMMEKDKQKWVQWETEARESKRYQDDVLEEDKSLGIETPGEV